MSFILDALKKSERERQRQTNPGLFEMKVAPPRNRFPIWAVVIGALLIVNSGVVIWLLIHKSSQAENGPQAAPAGQAPYAQNGAPQGATPYGPGPMGPANAGQGPYPGATYGPANPGPGAYGSLAQGQPPYASAPQYGVPAGQQPYPPYGQPPSAAMQAPYGYNAPSNGGQYFGNPSTAMGAAAPDANDEPRLKGNAADEDVLNPDDYEPAAETPRSSRSAAARKQPAASTDESAADASNATAEQARRAEKGLLTYQDAAAMPGMNMPPLRLDLHVYDPEPAKSFVLVNMQKVKPGDNLNPGVHVDQITPSGAILTFRGVRFLLRSE